MARSSCPPTPADGRRCGPAHPNCATQLSSWNSTRQSTELPSLIGGSTTPASTTGSRRSRGCRASPTGSPTILTGDPT